MNPSATASAPERWRVLLDGGRLDVLREQVDRALADQGQQASDIDGELWLVRGRMAQVANDHQTAMAAFDAAIRYLPAPALEAKHGRATSLYLLGRADAAKFEWAGVLDSFQSATQSGASASANDIKNVNNVNNVIAAALAAEALGRWNPASLRTAVELFELAMAQDPSDHRPRLVLAELLLEKYNSREAIELLGEVLNGATEPSVSALYLLARVQHFDHSRQAEMTLAQALERDDSYLPALLLRARLHIEAERYEQAKADLAAALALNPHHLDGLALRASIAFLEADGELFESDIRLARELAPGSAKVFLILAETAARNRRYNSAVQFALGAISIDRREWQGYVTLGVNRMRQGDMQAGREALTIGFRGDPFNIWAKNTLDLLDKIDGFSTHKSENFLLVAPANEGPVLAPYLLPVAEEAFATFARRYGHQPRGPIRIEVYAEHEDFSVRTAGVVGLGILGVSFGPVVALDSPSAGDFGPLNWASVLWHEIAHSFHLSMSRHQSPRWFSEGLAVYEEHHARPGWGADATPGFLKAYAEGKLPPPSGLNQAFLAPSYPDQVIHGYYLGSLLIEYLVEEFGFDSINAMLNGFAERRDFAMLTPEVLGISPEQLDQQFDRFLQARLKGPIAALASSESEPNGPYPKALAQAAEALKNDDLDAAEMLARKAQGLFPEHAGPGSAMDLLAEVLVRRGNRLGAIHWLRRSIDVDADDIRGHRRLAGLLSELGDRSGASDVLRRSVLIDPFKADVHAALAQHGEANEDWVAAVMGRAAVMHLSPDDPVAAGEKLARAHMMGGDLPAAKRALLQALEQAPLYDRGLELLLELRSRAVQVAPDNKDSQ